jgi:UDP-glucose 4-epimerase
MRILVSGAHGYIGSKLVERLRSEGHEVTGIIRSPRRIATPWAGSVGTIVWDMTSPFAGEPPKGFDLMVHAAGANDVDSADMREALMGTALSTRNAVEFCRAAGIRRVIWFSTFQVFGANDGEVSDDSPVECRNDYALTHWFGEQYLCMAERNGWLDWAAVRPTNVYGAPLDRSIDRWTLVPACFCKSAFEDQEIVLRSSGRQSRNFVHLDAVVDSITYIAGHFDRAKGRAHIVAGPEVATIRAVAEQVLSAYVTRFGRECRLVVESEMPAQATELRVAAAGLDALGYRAPTAPTVADEIDNLFDLLSR